jgi:hypothetical protein
VVQTQGWITICPSRPDAGFSASAIAGGLAPPLPLNKRRKAMSEKKTHLYVLWTNDNWITAEKMVFMYTVNSLVFGWWERVTLIIWGATAKLVSENKEMQKKVQEARDAGVHITACKACADQLGVTQALEDLHIEVKYWGAPLTEILANGEKLLTV